MATVLARMVGTDIYVIPGDVMRCDRRELIWDAGCLYDFNLTQIVGSVINSLRDDIF